MNYRIIPVTAFFQNCSLIWCNQTKLGSLIDPGGDKERIIQEITTTGIRLVNILLTHGHLDHVGAANSLAKYYKVPIVGPGKGDECLLRELPTQSRILGLDWCNPLNPSRWLREGDKLTIGNIELQVLHCPGHTPGHVAFFNKRSSLLISGDVLFKGSVGLTTFPYSNRRQLFSSIKKKLFSLGERVTFIAGHGPTSTLGYERQHNPFFTESKNFSV